MNRLIFMLERQFDHQKSDNFHKRTIHMKNFVPSSHEKTKSGSMYNDQQE